MTTYQIFKALAKSFGDIALHFCMDLQQGEHDRAHAHAHARAHAHAHAHDENDRGRECARYYCY